MSDFRPEYPGDTPNRAWVRRKCEEKGMEIDDVHVILNFSAAHIRWLFNKILSPEWDFERGIWKL